MMKQGGKYSTMVLVFLMRLEKLEVVVLGSNKIPKEKFSKIKTDFEIKEF